MFVLYLLLDINCSTAVNSDSFTLTNNRAEETHDEKSFQLRKRRDAADPSEKDMGDSDKYTFENQQHQRLRRQNDEGSQQPNDNGNGENRPRGGPRGHKHHRGPGGCGPPPPPPGQDDEAPDMNNDENQQQQ